MKQTTTSDGKVIPSIVYNGNEYIDGQAMQKLFLEIMPPTHFEVHCIDSHYLNPEYLLGQNTGSSLGSGMSALVVVSGSVRLDDDRSTPLRGFSESFVLIPNDAIGPGRRTRGRAAQEYAIQSQMFRLIS